MAVYRHKTRAEGNTVYILDELEEQRCFICGAEAQKQRCYTCKTTHYHGEVHFQGGKLAALCNEHGDESHQQAYLKFKREVDQIIEDTQ